MPCPVAPDLGPGDAVLRLLDHLRWGRVRRLPAGYFERGLVRELPDWPASLSSFAFREAAAHALEGLESPVEAVSSGFSDLDRALEGGFVPGRLYVVTGAEEVGKTALVGSIACEVAKAGKAVLLMSLQHAAAEFARRMLQGIAGVEVRPGRRGAKDALAALRTAMTEIADIPLVIDDGLMFSWLDVQHRILGNEQQLIVLDGIEFMLGRNEPEERDGELWELMTGLRWLTRASACPVICTMRVAIPGSAARRCEVWPRREGLPGAVLATADAVLQLARLDWYEQERERHNYARIQVDHNRWARSKVAVVGLRQPPWFDDRRSAPTETGGDVEPDAPIDSQRTPEQPSWAAEADGAGTARTVGGGFNSAGEPHAGRSS